MGAMDERMPRRAVSTARARVVDATRAVDRTESLATEEPMEIRAHGPGQRAVPVAVTMRTPGSDFDLAAGFLWTEALIDDPSAIRRVSYCEDLEGEEQHYNVVTVELAGPFDDQRRSHRAPVTASCGICAKSTLDEVEVACAALGAGPSIDAGVLASLPQALLAAQPVFARTGGLHAAGLFDPSGRLESLREDIGRHNAVDKVVGDALLHGRLPLAERVLQVSGRIGFEIVQKAARAGIAVVSAVGAPSSLAVAAAERLGVTLCGFVRDGRATIYAHPRRIR